ncbi:flagellar basal body rod protein FlgC [Listeria monocytogenes]|uniref:flagellar basal body rod protein FlgC n=1 Tax=Listeria monocytogenes TaxID=1639 RepID=UPI0008741B05|nr:flagellar basal body rod protein FlgC [Listeria monocytogenes]EAC3746489.1 flagellar basal body rod protein FlgC [Listeria monocytogenes]EAC7951214.1 flagellar basal body rod protein FlgC [Listeria monocytogenes]EAD6488824.1 flagellar basal body rod protein FlgC [Listeria monocytogenes]EAD7578180.1 flagellar basal body rod protein FlgC [Listeria monocytogenes]EAE5980974.1 flagellar basal body rod protein FlgC [Listeria monocytogenes]
MFEGINTSGSALNAAKQWMEVSSNNIANADSSAAPGEIPFLRKRVVLSEITPFETALTGTKGVKVSEISSDTGSVKRVYDPTHPNANEAGYVNYANVDMTAEMTNLMVGQKMYAANTSALQANEKMMEKDLEIGKV